MITVEQLTRYPVKGLSGEPLERVVLEPGQGFPCDRMFGFARPDSGFDPDNPKPMPKSKFYMLARDERLALMKSEYDESSGVLTMQDQNSVQKFAINTPEGSSEASSYLKTFLQLPENEMPKLFHAAPHRFTDVSVESQAMMNAVSIINLESVAEFSRALGDNIDPLRFRGNLHVKGMPAFSELEMIGQHLTIGEAKLKIVKRTRRCPATEVNLQNAIRDVEVPRKLAELFGHSDMGVYAEVIEGGVVETGAPINIS